MNSHQPTIHGYLDTIRINDGADKCRAALNSAFRSDTRRAAALLNDPKLTFPCLYTLRDQIEGLRMQRSLSLRNRIAMRIANQIRASGPSGAEYLSSREDAIYATLKWMLETGSAEEIPDDDYEQILDVTVLVLISVYGDRGVLPLVTDLIFKRNRDDRYTHDLIWALFQVHDPQVLRLIAERIRSSNPKDAALANELLNLDETGVPAGRGDPQARYEGYLHWLTENEPYLYFTQESFQYASKPALCAVDLARKYLQKGTASFDKQPISPSDDDESETLMAFGELGAGEQKTLSEYSQKLHGRSVLEWNRWLHAPVKERIRAAKAGLEGDE